jgi:hypothetical protein
VNERNQTPLLKVTAATITDDAVYRALPYFVQCASMSVLNIGPYFFFYLAPLLRFLSGTTAFRNQLATSIPS